MNRKVYLMDLCPTPENFRTIGPGIWEEIANYTYIDRQIGNCGKICN